MNLPNTKSSPTPRAPDKCGPLAALSGSRPQAAASASGGFVRQIPPLPVTPAVGLCSKLLFWIWRGLSSVIRINQEKVQERWKNEY